MATTGSPLLCIVRCSLVTDIGCRLSFAATRHIIGTEEPTYRATSLQRHCRQGTCNRLGMTHPTLKTHHTVPLRPMRRASLQSTPVSFTVPSSSSQLSDCPVLFTLPLPHDTTLAGLVCTYGFYALPPNIWLPCNSDIQSIDLLTERSTHAQPRHGVQFQRVGTVTHGCFIRALRYDVDDEDAVWAVITQEAAASSSSVGHVEVSRQAATKQPDTQHTTQHQPRHHSSQQLVVRALQPPLRAVEAAHESAPSTFALHFTASQLQCIEQQIRRMFNLDGQQPYEQFYELMPLAREHGFARLFRSPTLFEDCVKTITLCNASWTRTTAMNEALSTQVGLGRRYQLRLTIVAPPLQHALLNLSSTQGVRESAQSRKMRGGKMTEMLEGERVTGLRHDLTVGVFPSPKELAASTWDVLRIQSQPPACHMRC